MVMLAVVGLLVASVSVRAQVELVLQKEGSAEYHRPGCPLVKDSVGVLALSRAQAESRGLKPHEACDPVKVAGGEKAGRGEAPPVHVLLDRSKYYHRDTCKKIKGQTKRVTLELAAKSRWPCPVCKPPIRRRPSPAIPRRVP